MEMFVVTIMRLLHDVHTITQPTEELVSDRPCVCI